MKNFKTQILAMISLIALVVLSAVVNKISALIIIFCVLVSIWLNIFGYDKFPKILKFLAKNKSNRRSLRITFAAIVIASLGIGGYIATSILTTRQYDLLWIILLALYLLVVLVLVFVAEYVYGLTKYKPQKDLNASP